MPDPSCATCRHWSPYLPGLGECMEPITRWRRAWVRADDGEAFQREHPKPATPDREATDGCDRIEVVEPAEASCTRCGRDQRRGDLTCLDC